MNREFKPLMLDDYAPTMFYKEFIRIMRERYPEVKVRATINPTKDSWLQRMVDEYLKDGGVKFKFKNPCE